jgi:O-antigen/teichoic acid export membrane protein
VTDQTTPTSAVHVARGTSYVIIQNLTTNVAQIVSFAILARLIAPKEMGILAVLSLLDGACYVIGTVALHQAATRFVAENLPQNKRPVAASVFYQAIRTTFFLAALLGAFVFLGSGSLSIHLLGAKNYATYFQVLGFDIVLYSGLIPVLSSAMVGLQKFKETAGVGIIGTLMRQSLIILFVLLLQSFLGLVVAWVVSDVAVASVYMAYLLRYLGPPRFDFPLMKLVSYSWPLAVSNGVSFVYSSFDYVVLLALAPLATLGVYNVTLQAFGALNGISNAIGTTLFAAYSAMQVQKRRGGSSDAVRLASRYVHLIAVPLALGLLATAKPALTLFVGRAYVAGSDPLMILSGIFAVTAIGITLSPMLLALAETRVASGITTGSVILSLTAAILLVPTLGMLGASVARGLGIIATTALTFLFLRRKLGLRLDLEMMFKTLAAGAIMAAIVVVVQITFYSAYLLPMYILIGAVAYLTGLRVLKAVKQDDIDLLGRYFGHKLRFVTSILSWVLLPAKIEEGHNNGTVG